LLEDLVDLGDQRRNLKMPFARPEGRGSEIGDDMIERCFRLRGFVSGPQVQKLNRNSIYLFVNGRLIRDRLLLHAISSAYHNLMPPACYPFALLFLDCDLEEVDVNVHPSKTEVRFHHGSLVHDFVRDTIRNLLMAQRPASSIPAPTPPQPGAELPFSEFSQRVENMTFETAPSLDTDAAGLPEFALRRSPAPPPRFDFSDAPSVSIKNGVPETHGPLFPDAYLPEPESLEALKDLRPLGQIHDSFIVAAGRDGLWIIDQHVAHERILFEQVLAARSAGSVETQRLLVPIVISLSAAQQVEYARIAEELNALGFETDPFGNRTIAVKSAPAGVGAADVEKVLFEILEISERELRCASLDDLRRSMAASIACRAAIKINMRLDQNKMEWLLRSLAATDCPMSCPHGRPIALQYSTREILKAFHRI
jgi:DNA mismatch repair protein MutL